MIDAEQSLQSLLTDREATQETITLTEKQLVEQTKLSEPIVSRVCSIDGRNC